MGICKILHVKIFHVYSCFILLQDLVSSYLHKILVRTNMHNLAR